MESRTGALLTIGIYKARNVLREGDSLKEEPIITTSTLAIWMVKVGTTSKSHVTQKEKKP